MISEGKKINKNSCLDLREQTLIHQVISVKSLESVLILCLKFEQSIYNSISFAIKNCGCQTGSHHQFTRLLQ